MHLLRTENLGLVKCFQIICRLKMKLQQTKAIILDIF